MNENEFHRIVDPEILQAIPEYQDQDPAALALRLAGHKDWPTRAIVEQVACRQKAMHKIPGWVAHNVLLDNTALQQASSEATARYKTTLKACSGQAAIDITGGLGVDSAAMSANFITFHYTDLNPVMCLIAKFNFSKLGLHNITVSNDDGLHILAFFPDHFFDMIYADPSRRVGTRRVISLQNSTPDIPGNLDLLKRKSNHILLKLSPVMDITDTIRLLSGISLIDVISYGGECRELLVLLDSNKMDQNGIKIRATQLNNRGEVIHQLERPADQALRAGTSPVGRYLYNPDPAFIKAGMTDHLCQTTGLSRIHPSVIYLTSDVCLAAFPGKIYQAIQVIPAHTREVTSYLKRNISQANIAARGFPESTETLYKRLKLKHGGNDYLFFTRDYNDQYIMIHSVTTEIASGDN